ncbi:MAG: DRTGG domain-containing protein [Anaerolineales bacterium]
MIMTVEDLLKILPGTVLTPQLSLRREVKGGCAADLMSDVLASVRAQALLLTGLCNIQVVRTAQMADVSAIVFVRGKQPSPETIALAVEENIPLLSTPLGMFELCGRLCQAGLPSSEDSLPQEP